MREASLLKKAEIALLTAASFWLLPTQAGVVIGGTRFVYPQDQRAISVTVRNKSSLPYLIGTKIYRGGRWPGRSSPRSGHRVVYRDAATFCTPART